MSRAKDKRIKKLKKKRIWASIIGVVVVSILLTVLMAGVVLFLIVEVLKNKVVEAYDNVDEMVDLVGQIDSAEGIAEIDDKLKFYVEIETDVESIVLMDAQDAVLWSSGNEYPSPNEEKLLLEDGINLIVVEHPDNLFIIRDDNLEFNKEADFHVDFVEIFNLDSLSKASNTAIAQMKVWIEVQTDFGNAYILKNLKVYNSDLFVLVVCGLIMAVMAAIFIIYYLISTISLIVNSRRSAKIIYTDVITGGNNWLYFEKEGATLLKKGLRREKNYALIHLKMRKYRSYCTCFGVKEGEVLIEKCYDILKRKTARKELVVHRENAQYGLLLLYEDREQLTRRIEEMEDALNAVSPNIKLYFGVGVYLAQQGDEDIDQLYNNALLACDILGEESESKIAFFDIEMNNQRIWERKVEDDLDRALVNKEFQVYLQPKISTAGEVLAGAEALVRWIHPQDGFIPPNKFIPILEKNGFITKLDDYMLEAVATLQANWIAQGHKIVPISVNVSRAHFTRNDLAQHICAIVDKYAVPHDVIELELTESAFFDDKKLLLDTVKQFREYGFSVSMDDFGAGYSSLNSLKEMPIDVLKIDADFFRGADVEERGLLIVSEVIDLAKKLNMKIVAEGIESREQVDFLTEQECDLIQGYFFAKPMPVVEFVEKYKDDMMQNDLLEEECNMNQQT